LAGFERLVEWIGWICLGISTPPQKKAGEFGKIKQEHQQENIDKILGEDERGPFCLSYVGEDDDDASSSPRASSYRHKRVAKENKFVNILFLFFSR